MNRNRKILLASAVTLPTFIAIAIAVWQAQIHVPGLNSSVTLMGSVLKDSSDPTQQPPLADTIVTATAGSTIVTAKSDPAGYFSLTLNLGLQNRKGVTLTFQHPDYKPLEITASKPGDQLYIARLQPLQPAAHRRLGAPAKPIEIKNIQIRYSFKDQSTMGIGSFAKQFEALNTGNVPCRGHEPCSPDGRWKATKSTLALDAEQGNEFRNVRVSCIAGPCAFTKIDPNTFAQPAQKMNISVLNWSDTADFLVEADVLRSMVSEMVRQSYPFIVGQTMNFSLPPSSEGPSVEADLDGQYIVFPLGPDLILSWATCTSEVFADQSRIYRCQLKPGYRF